LCAPKSKPNAACNSFALAQLQVGDLVVCEEALDRVAHRAAFTDQRIDIMPRAS